MPLKSECPCCEVRFAIVKPGIFKQRCICPAGETLVNRLNQYILTGEPDIYATDERQGKEGNLHQH